ncbi:uncharacterized protein EV154DRAFT_592879 [Mucor mucedo]|uniref:uncharacterized protein n=1 Tax=Mucor mucedo TaxID=29922 RepID=UPI0022212AC9|nr:uncharacterized protein EV154DRAFT_592879 [Mucor mucedo]KAI7888991.1 hypothetical protein EV154DRAFT_592879 [Mucor mucedo]
MKKVKKAIELSARDKIHVKGLRGTLGSNLYELAKKIEVKDKKSGYFYYLCKNSIIDLTNTKRGSQIDLLVVQNYRRISANLRIMIPSGPILKKVDGIKLLTNKYQEIDVHQPINEEEIVLKKIFTYILYPIVYNPTRITRHLFKQIIHYFPNGVVAIYSVFTAIYSLDVIIISEKNDNDIDVLSGAFASVRYATERQILRWCFKFLPVSLKQHLLKHLLSFAAYISASGIYKIKLPIIRMMGMNCQVSILNLIDKNVYSSQEIYSFKYPKTIKQIKEGGIQDLMAGLLLLENLLLDIEDIYNDCTNDTTDKIDNIRNERVHYKPKSVVDEYISAVTWNEDDNNSSNNIGSESEEEE